MTSSWSERKQVLFEKNKLSSLPCISAQIQDKGDKSIQEIYAEKDNKNNLMDDLWPSPVVSLILDDY